MRRSNSRFKESRKRLVNLKADLKDIKQKNKLGGCLKVEIIEI